MFVQSTLHFPMGRNVVYELFLFIDLNLVKQMPNVLAMFAGSPCRQPRQRGSRRAGVGSVLGTFRALTPEDAQQMVRTMDSRLGVEEVPREGFSSQIGKHVAN